MNMSSKISQVLGEIKTADLWKELAQRLGVRFGVIQIAIHDGRPSKYATVNQKIIADEKSGEISPENIG